MPGGRVEGARKTGPVLSGLILAALAVLAIYPALLNGYALVFADTGGYLDAQHFATRPPFYEWFVSATSLEASLWGTVLAQGLLSVAVIDIAFRRGADAAGLWRFAAAALVLAATQLPWLASWIMPDVLAGLGAVAVILMLLVPLGRWDFVCLAAVIFLATTSASANPPLYLGLLVFTALAALVLARPIAWRALAATGGVLVASTLALVLANTVLHGKPGLNAADGAMTFGRLSDAGLAYAPTAKACETTSYAICAHLEALRTTRPGYQDFLWGGLAHATNAFDDNDPQYDALSGLAIRADPMALLRSGLGKSLAMARRPILEERLDLAAGPELEALRIVMAHDYPSELATLEGARQQRGTLSPLFSQTLFTLSAYASYVGLAVLAILALGRGDRTGAVMAAAVFAFIAAHILLHGLLVGAYGRYHAKAGWLAALFAVILAARLWPPVFIAAPPERALGKPRRHR